VAAALRAMPKSVALRPGYAEAAASNWSFWAGSPRRLCCPASCHFAVALHGHAVLIHREADLGMSQFWDRFPPDAVDQGSGESVRYQEGT
jgi:hypothetical protein